MEREKEGVAKLHVIVDIHRGIDIFNLLLACDSRPPLNPV